MCRPALTRLLLLHLLLIKLHSARGGSGSEGRRTGGLGLQTCRASARQAFAGTGLVPLLGSRGVGVARSLPAREGIRLCAGVCVCV